ncbi:hypothetical protein ACFQU2_34330 [Siccirubricoccus deserti]
MRRIEDRPLVSGAGRFTDDESLHGEIHLVFLRSPHAHARIVSIDTAAALALPGVVAVLTGEDLEAAGLRRLGVALPFKSRTARRLRRRRGRCWRSARSASPARRSRRSSPKASASPATPPIWSRWSTRSCRR